MRFKYIFLLSLCLIPNLVWAQYEEDEDEEAEKERILNDPASAAAGRKAQLESAWSLSDPDFKFKEAYRHEDGAWDTREINAQVRPISVPKSSSMKKKSSKYKVGTHVITNPKFMQMRRKQIIQGQKERARQEEIRKQQQALNRIQQGVQYNASMSNYRIQNTQRLIDRIEKLEQVNAVDFANVPQGTAGAKPNTLSNKQMANLLKPKKEEKGSITVLFIEPNTERENHQNVSLMQNKKLNLYDDGGYDQKELDLWKDAFFSEKPIVQPCSTATLNEVQQYEATILIENNFLNLDSFNITTLPDMGCIALIGDSILLLDNDSLTFLKWSVPSDVSQVIACGDRTIGKRYNQIVEIKKDGLGIICELDNEEFNIYAESDSTFILCASVVDLYVVTRVNINTGTYDELLRTPTIIRKVVSNGKIILTLLKKRIIDITESPKLFYLSETRINDLCMCNEGLLLATDENVLLLKSPTEILTFTKEGAKKIWCDGTDIYLINKKGDLIRYSKKL
ncbi:MAG: hypothetical protein J6W52_02580 [Bacteroidaceae bacterium]|nr:hypothetical protein [Bacteroidaceae bacterium]